MRRIRSGVNMYQPAVGFAIQMPDEPEVSIDQVSSPDGLVSMHSIHANLKGGGSCTSIYFDYSEYQLTIPIEGLLDGAIKRFLKNSDAVLITKKEIELDGYKGFEIETKPNSTRFRTWLPTVVSESRRTSINFWSRSQHRGQ